MARKVTGASQNDANVASVPSDDWLEPSEIAELEAEMFKKGIEKYGLDEETAREWARAFCRSDEDHLEFESRAS